MPRAVHFGAGNIGRGFLGQLYFESGFRTTFIDVEPTLVAALNAAGGYTIHIAEEAPSSVRIESFDAVDGRDLAAVAEAVSTADIASVAVGVRALPLVAPGLAAGLARRDRTLDVIVAENQLHAAARLRDAVASQGLPARHPAGFVDASVGRMVPVRSAAERAADPLAVWVEAYCDLPVDAEAFVGAFPSINHLLPMPAFEAILERKLFVHNGGHAAAAYFGWLRGHAFLWQAVADPVVRPLVEGAMAEACKALSRRHGLPLPDLREHADDLLRRFGNRALGDTVLRVGADPMRKLGSEDRLIGALAMAEEEGVDAPCLALAAAAALAFDPPGDPSAAELQALLAKDASGEALVRITGLPTDHPVLAQVAVACPRLGILRP